MQKAVALILIFVLTLLSGCAEDNMEQSDFQPNDASLEDFFSNDSDDVSSNVEDKKQSKKLFKGLWISCYEYELVGKTEKQAKKILLEKMELAAKQGYTAVFCHVRANADAFYPSKYFPFATQITGKAGKNPGYDPLKIMIEAARKYSLEFHAWINPYRVNNASPDPNKLAENHIAKTWLSDGSNRAVVFGDGIYFNPASVDVQKLILDGIREILDNYSVDGIHFDDYFYPENITEEFDLKHYEEYLNTTEKPLSLADFRRANVNALVSAVYNLCRSKNTIFGISPSGLMSLDNSHKTYNLLYADVALWMRDEGYIDYILPQIYYGYNHPTQTAQYAYLLDIWANLPRHKNLKLYIGLAAYKMNQECTDKAEWHIETDILARQATDAIKSGAEGIAVFSYNSTANKSQHNSLQIENMFNALKEYS